MEPEPTKEHENARSYTSSEWWLVYITSALVLATVGLMIYTARLWGATESLAKDAKQTAVRQASEMQDSLRISRAAADAAMKSADASLMALRPWLSCEVDITGPLIFNAEKDAVFRLRFTIKNTGKTPAMNVSNFFPRFNLSAPGYEHSILKLQKLAEGSRGLPISGPGIILFPDKELIEHIQYPIPRAELEKACKDLSAPKHFWPELIVLIAYTYPLANIRADTGMIYEISRSDGKPLVLDEGLSEGEMRISLHKMWGGIAT
jgi:hypothetical protein